MAKRPNIVLFLTDDHASWALGCYGNRDVRSPSLDSLASGGVRFANAFTPSPVCSPARACVFTGLTPSQVGMHDWLQERQPEIGNHDWLAGIRTLPELLSESGYHCGLSGKWHIGQSHLMPRGFAWHFGLPGWQGHHIGEYTYVYNGQSLNLNGNKTQFITDYALQFLESAPRERPFFLNVGYISTHSPYDNQDPELVALYDHLGPKSISIRERHPWAHHEGYPRDATWDRTEMVKRWRNYYAAVTDIDRNVERISRRLAEMGELDNTLFIYTSDHGMGLGQRGFFGKGNGTRPLNMYETSIRVPLVMRFPAGFASGCVVEHCVDHYDTFKTILDVAGVAAPSGSYPGSNYAELARGRSVNWSDARFGEYGDLRMIRTPEFKLVRRYASGPDDLFDLKNDAEETRNLAEQPEFAATKARLQAELDSFYKRYEVPERSGLRVKTLRQHNGTPGASSEAWRDGCRERLGLQTY